ncbi:MAG: hypothetical protein Q8P18_23370 [Pseudomonadota bacterium]|nr:hypothetical protein [Pseudomonadota bacterium]
MGLVLALLGCHYFEAAPESPMLGLAPREALLRLSVDLRGVHPTEEELVAIDANPDLYAQYVERYLEDPRFVGRMREVFNLRYLTRTGDTYFDTTEAGLGDIASTTVGDSIGEEPLRLLTYLIEEDLPYSYIVTASHTMADPVLARMWDLEREPGDAPDDQGWAPATWRDGRPAAGMLSMTTIWQRYPSMGGNANRHRANAISRMLLCDDYLSRPIVLNRAAVDLLTLDPENAIAVTASCQSCHSTLDPLAGTLFGFFHYDANQSIDDAITYRPETEEAWRDYSGKEPGYFGRPTANLVELGANIAADPRFAECAVRTVWEGFSQRSYTDDDWEEVAALRDVYEVDGARLTPVVRALVTSAAYRAGSVVAGIGDDADLDERLATVRVVSPAQLQSVVEDLTTYRWTFDGRPGLTSNDVGMQVLAGGVDSRYVTLPSYTPSLGLAFVQERLAQAAGRHVAEHDLAEGRAGDAILLRYVTALDTPESAPDAFEAQIRFLYLRITGAPLPAEATEPLALAALWNELMKVEDSPTSAWAGVVSAVLRDPAVLFY